jgi:hypothetical protein
MPLWLAAILAVVFIAGVTALSVFARRKGKKALLITAIVVAGVVLLAILAYVLLTFIFLDYIGNQTPDEPPEVTAAAPTITASPTAKPTVKPTPTAIPTPTPTPVPVTPEPKPADYDLPTDEVPEFHPDVLGLRIVKYDEQPVFGTQNEVTAFVLYNFLNNTFDFELYLDKDFAVDEGTGYSILNNACETAMTYYLFGSYNVFNMFTKERENNVYAKITLTYTDPEYDLEAKAEALEYVMKNPVPIGGFSDFKSEKAYAKKIHDFIAKKITYSPIGYDPESMFGMTQFEALQEAYNVLAETENTAVCAGYARAFALIAQYAGINAVWVFGNETETESHAWNIVYPCDGSEPVLVDVTWDDTESADFPEQEYVSDWYFYIPLSLEYQHRTDEDFDEFLRYINKE